MRRRKIRFTDVNQPRWIEYEQRDGPELQKIIVEHKSGGQVVASHPMSVVCTLCDEIMPNEFEKREKQNVQQIQNRD